ncbi:MAG: hypothetical protein JSR60_01815 [Proteobacteria bacterium]|nr:hypothetical protein [Pseudomonadota bacterium]
MSRAFDIIESYVIDVAACLPRAQRADVAAELRSLLREEIGADTPENEVIARLRAFGRPADVAARYHPPYTLIESTDTRGFVLAAVIGALLIPPANQRLPLSVDQNTASIFFLAWLGALLLLFAAKSWAFRRWPSLSRWNPTRLRDYDAVRMIEQIPIVAILVFYEAAYLMPATVIGALSGGNIPAGVLDYTADFLNPIRMWWFALFGFALIVLEAAMIARGRWSRVTRTLEIVLFLLAGTQLGWHASYGDIFANVQAEHGARMAFQLLGAAFVLTAVLKIYREWRRLPPLEAVSVAA